MEVLRTPDSAFADVPDFAYEPNYTTITAHDGTPLRLHHVDAGPLDAHETILCLHGEPSWGFLYRTMIPEFVAAGHRVVVPDLVGFGRSDKPTRMTDHTYERHVDWMCQWLLANNFHGVTLVGQDWGGLIGLRVALALPQRFSRIVVANTGLPTGDPAPGEAFLKWREFSQKVDPFPTSSIIQGGCTTKPLAPAVLAAYDAPFPSEEFKAGPKIMPSLVPASLDDPSSKPNRDAWESLRRWTKPLVTLFSDGDPVTKNGEWIFRREVPGAAGMPHATIEGGGHFLQEDRGPQLAAAINAFVSRTY